VINTEYLNEVELQALGVGKVGENVRVSSLATIVGIENLFLGSNIRIDSYNVIICSRGKLIIGNNVHIEPSSSIIAHNGIEIGNYCTISHGVRLFTASADYSGFFHTNTFPIPDLQNPISGPIKIEDYVIVGANSVVMPNLTIKKGAAIGALSFVRENVEGWSIYGGNPLKFIKKRSQKILELIKKHEIN
jgi:galactoside O-acetyltransferase